MGPTSVRGVLGPYRLIAEIGRGGMGTVYRAVRADGEIDRAVALKVAGDVATTPDAERRFVRESRILAGLDHAHIVRLLDAGVADGQRYVAMELVEGTPLPTAVAERRLAPAQIVRLYRQLCGAILYAHQRLVLHRDLKPANVLLTHDGQVKVLDFGIAQLVQASTLTSDTQTAVQPLSLACASPEQVRGEPLSFTSDIYALGTLLYEGLTGSNPQFREGASVEETLRMVIDQEPPRPSRVNPLVPRDLDAVVMKALAKRPADRYQSVADLDADLARWLEGRPVSAVPPHAWYVFTRFVRRNKAVSATAAALLVSVTVGALVVSQQARVAERRFEDARRLIHTTIFDIQPQMEAIPATLELRRMLIERTTQYLEAVSADAAGNVPLLQELSSAYVQLARLQGDISTSTLGNRDAASARFARARTLLDDALRIEPGNAALLKDATVLYSRLATFEGSQGRPDAALEYARTASAFADRNLAARPGEYDARELRAMARFTEALNTPASAWTQRRDLFSGALNEYRALAAENPAREPVRRNVGIVSRQLASLHHDQGLAADAAGYAEEALAVSEGLLAARPTDTALQLEVVTDAYLSGMVLDLAGRGTEAPVHYQRALDLAGTLRQADTSNVRAAILFGEASRLFAGNRLKAGDGRAARTHADTAVSVYAAMAGTAALSPIVQWRYASALATLADVAAADGRPGDACAAYLRAHTLFDDAHRQNPLTGSVLADAERVAIRASGCATRAAATP